MHAELIYVCVLIAAPTISDNMICSRRCPLPRCNYLLVDRARCLFLPINPLAATCHRCNSDLDTYGFHLTTCMRTGLVMSRHNHLVKAWGLVFKESGRALARRDYERYIRDTHLRRDVNDNRRLDIVTTGIHGVFQGKPLFIDVTCVSPISGQGVPKPRAADENGAVLTNKDNENGKNVNNDTSNSSSFA